MTDTTPAKLPSEFADLEQYVPGWGAPSTNVRNDHRHSCTMEQIQTFYDAFQPRLDAAFAYLDQFDTHTLPETAKRLLFLAFGYIEAALAVEVFKEPGVPGIPYPHGFFTISRELL